MIELLLEFLVSGFIELVVEAFARGGSEKSVREPQDSPSPGSQGDRRITIGMLVVGAVGGAAWGFYVGRSSSEWPTTFWTFAALGVIALALQFVGASNERFASRIGNPTLRHLITFTPQRFARLAKFSGVAALFIVIGFFFAG